MSYTKNYRIRCDDCGLFCVPFDSETPFGCADPEYPEPYDPYHYCESCSEKLYRKYLEGFRKGKRSGNYEKSNAEMRAAKDCGLVWLHSSGVGTYGTETNRSPYQYIPKEEYEELSKLPRFLPLQIKEGLK